MGKIALLVPREEMIRQAHNILQEKEYKIQEMRVVQTETAVVEARQSIADGASIIIARGLHAYMIKQYTDIPVVEIVLTAQEMALLVNRARQIVKKPRPVIGVVGFRNMFCDMSYFNELYEIELRTYYVKQAAELPGAAWKAVEDQVDLIIGGDTVVEIATEAGVPSLFLSMTEDSLRQAFAMAERMDYAVSVEKKTAAQMETLLDYSFNGIIRLDAAGVVTAVNPLMEDMIGKKQGELKGKPVREIAPQLGQEELDRVLKEGKEYSRFLEWSRGSVFAVLAPVLYEDRVDGAIITCHKMTKRPAPVRQEAEEERSARGLPALSRFEDILQQSRAMQDCVHLARLYALSDQPVVLMGEPGTERRILAECIHNSSARGGGPFLDVPCDGLMGEEQRAVIFGERGAAVQAQGGTLLIQDAEELTPDNQYRLYQLVRFHVCHGSDIASLRKVDVRVIVTVGHSLAELMAAGKLRQDLYYLLSGLELTVPPLRERKEDLRQKIEDTIRECCGRYSRYHVLTSGARALLMDYPWKGNLFQIESFLDRLILTASRRSIDEIAVKRLMEELYPAGLYREDGKAEEKGTPPREPLFGGSEEAQRIAGALRRYDGSRSRTAEELGISKATLWRRMKKYGLE